MSSAALTPHTPWLPFGLARRPGSINHFTSVRYHGVLVEMLSPLQITSWPFGSFPSCSSLVVLHAHHKASFILRCQPDATPESLLHNNVHFDPFIIPKHNCSRLLAVNSQILSSKIGTCGLDLSLRNNQQALSWCPTYHTRNQNTSLLIISRQIQPLAIADPKHTLHTQ
jgi:hypothetical protein